MQSTVGLGSVGNRSQTMGNRAVIVRGWFGRSPQARVWSTRLRRVVGRSH